MRTLFKDGKALPVGQPTLKPGSPRSDYSSNRSRYLALKRSLDVVLAAVLLVVTAPVLLLALAFTKLTSRGPLLYSQVRLGLNGRPFRLYKIRTMEPDCERQSGICWSVPGDPRVTAVGKLLRCTKIDELPQLWNVLRGEMSLIGPRPERPEIVARLAKLLPRYRERLQLLPGLSGLAQVQLPGDNDLASVQRKLTCDLCYLERISLALDLKIVVATVLFLARLPVPWIQACLRLPTSVCEEQQLRSLRNTVVVRTTVLIAGTPHRSPPAKSDDPLPAKQEVAAEEAEVPNGTVEPAVVLPQYAQG